MPHIVAIHTNIDTVPGTTEITVGKIIIIDLWFNERHDTTLILGFFSREFENLNNFGENQIFSLKLMCK